jgi:hypothetical protein
MRWTRVLGPREFDRWGVWIAGDAGECRMWFGNCLVAVMALFALWMGYRPGSIFMEIGRYRRARLARHSGSEARAIRTWWDR